MIWNSILLSSNFNDLTILDTAPLSLHSPLGQVAVDDATLRRSKTLNTVILASQQLDWASVTMEFSETHWQRKSGTAALAGIWRGACVRDRCVANVRHVISLHGRRFDIAVFSYWHGIWLNSWSKKKKNKINYEGKFGNSAWRTVLWSQSRTEATVTKWWEQSHRGCVTQTDTLKVNGYLWILHERVIEKKSKGGESGSTPNIIDQQSYISQQAYFTVPQ